MNTPRRSPLYLAPVALAALLWSCGEPSDSGSRQASAGATARPSGASAAPAPSSFDSASCAECHAAEYDAWLGSDHDRALELPSEASVEGDFDGTTFTWTRDGEQHSASFRREGVSFVVNIEDARGVARDYTVVHTFGVRPLQQYLVRVSGATGAGPSDAAAADRSSAPPTSTTSAPATASLPVGNLQCLPVAWDTERGEWFHLSPDADPGTPFHWTGGYQSWNLMCAECHSTELDKGYDPELGTYATTWVEEDVGCRACHGDATEHLRLVGDAGGGLERDDADYPAGGGFAAQLSPYLPGGARAQVDTCATCHSRRSEVRDGFAPGDAFLDHFDPALLREGLYHDDGAIQDEVYVWGSFAQSRMHAAGVSCTDCHDPHTARLRIGLPSATSDAGKSATGEPLSAAAMDAARRAGHYSHAQLDLLCATCHSAAAVPAQASRFPTLRAADYATPAHTRHPVPADAADATGPDATLLAEAASCVTCHMSEVTYMGVDARRDHAMRVPRTGAGETGPDLCLRCHDDKSRGWAEDELDHWVERGEGTPGAANRAAAGFASVFANARAGRPDALDGLIDVATDSGRPAIVRATALELVAAWGPGSRGAILANLTGNGPAAGQPGAATTNAPAAPEVYSDLLRATALRAARGAGLSPDPALVAILEQLLDDQRPAVRLALARWANWSRWSEWARPEHQDAVAALATELEASLQLQADMPSTHLDLGILAEERGDAAGAVAAYARALELDPGLYPASMNLATLQSSMDGREGLGRARFTLEAALAQDLPDARVEGELRYSLGLLLAEQGDLEGALTPLRRAAELMPDQARVDRNLCLVLWNLAREDEARAIAERALGRIDARPPALRTPEDQALAAELRSLLAR